MANYPIHRRCKDNDYMLGATSSFYSDEYADNMCSLHLRDELHKDTKGNLQRYYRLRAHQPHTIEMALHYEIDCPECRNGRLKQVGRCLNSHELGLYICPVCEKRKSSY